MDFSASHEYRIVRALSRIEGASGKFHVYVNDSTTPNVMTFGFRTIGVARGLHDSASDKELCGVLCHEIGHIKHFDYLYGNLIYSMEYLGQ